MTSSKPIPRIDPCTSRSLIAGPIAVIDVETTGLFPFRHDRVVEVAAVVVRAGGRLEREFVSLVNPARDIGPSSIHGLTSEDILHAPQFAEIAALLLDVLSGTVAIAAHDVRFDRQFVAANRVRVTAHVPISNRFTPRQLPRPSASASFSVRRSRPQRTTQFAANPARACTIEIPRSL